jgi:eukaryotic-like serine/threonine-protein kinase
MRPAVRQPLSHPNILKINDFGTDARGITYAVFEEIEGSTLSDLMASETLEEKRALVIARQVAQALAAAHGKKIVHGRLDPRSIYVNSLENGDDEVKVFGFGSDPLSVPRDADPRYLGSRAVQCLPRRRRAF